jgi:hypothetical protein
VRMTLSSDQPVLWSDQGVETELLSSAEEVIENESPEVRLLTSDGVGIGVSQMAGNVNAALPANSAAR